MAKIATISCIKYCTSGLLVDLTTKLRKLTYFEMKVHFEENVN